VKEGNIPGREKRESQTTRIRREGRFGKIFRTRVKERKR